MLLSGLPEQVGNEERLARFLTSSSHCNTTMVRPAAFLPETNAWETSVFRVVIGPLEGLWAVGAEHAAQGRNLHGAAIIEARNIRAVGLDVIAEEPPPMHAAIRNWPLLQNDPEMQKARHKELAIKLASQAILRRR